jgi:hypothetical protein
MRAVLRALPLACATVVVVLEACRDDHHPPPTRGVTEMQAETPDGAPAEVWVAPERDKRPCPAPVDLTTGAPDCGWLLHVVNEHGTDAHVDRIDLDVAGLDEADRAAVLDAPEGTIILQGTAEGSAFVVRRAFRALPIEMTPAEEVFLQIRRRLDIQCATPTCSEASRAVELNVGLEVPLPALDLSPAEVPLLDHTWLTAQVRERGAVLSGTFTGVPGERGIARFVANQVYVPLPDRLAPCPAPEGRQCGRGEVEVYTRDADRCILSLGCASPSQCTGRLPDCSPGYVLRTWRGSAGACPEFACDPAFLPE